MINANSHVEKRYTPTEISSLVLKAMIDRLEVHMGIRKILGWRLKTATISVPAEFTDEQKRATIEAGTLFVFSRLHTATFFFV